MIGPADLEDMYERYAEDRLAEVQRQYQDCLNRVAVTGGTYLSDHIEAYVSPGDEPGAVNVAFVAKTAYGETFLGALQEQWPW